MPILINMSSLDHSSATEGHLEPAITLLDGRVLPCYPRREADGQPADSPKKDTSDRAEKFFTEHACFFFDHSERILSDSRMFLAPVPIQSGLAYVGGTGFRNPTLGVYIEWWMNHAPAIVGKSGKECWLVYHIAGSPLSGRNSCGMVNQKGELKGKCIPGQFKDLWVPFIQTNTRYDEAKERYEAYTLEKVVKLLEAGGKEVSQPERALRFLQQKKVVFLHRIWGLVTPAPEEKEKMRCKLL